MHNSKAIGTSWRSIFLPLSLRKGKWRHGAEIYMNFQEVKGVETG
jgi:hypothetical protein